MKFKYNTLGFDKVYVINLKHRTDRRDKLIQDNPGINFTFIEAIEGKNLNIPECIQNEIIHTSFYDPTGMVTANIFACALSHKKAWDQALKDKVETALFLEDDIHFVHPFINVKNKKLDPLYNDILNSIKGFDWDILEFGKKKEFNYGIKINDYFVSPPYRSNYDGAHAYAVKRNMIKTLSDQRLPIKCAADVYLNNFPATHNVFTLKQSLIRQDSDLINSQNADSDTYYNEYREGGGKIGISFDHNGNVIDKKIAKYIKHPTDFSREYVEVVLEKPKFGQQFFTSKNKKNLNFFGLSQLLIFLSKNLEDNSKMIEVNPHFGESTFFFGSSGLFSNIFAIDPLKGKDNFNIKHKLSWEDIKIGFHSNTYHFDNINYINNFSEDVVGSFKDISFIYINNRDNKDINPLLDLYLPIIKPNGYIGGKGITPIKNKIEFEDGSWLIKKEDVTRI